MKILLICLFLVTSWLGFWMGSAGWDDGVIEAKEQRNSRWECFFNGENVYTGADRPRWMGARWYLINGKKLKADHCPGAFTG